MFFGIEISNFAQRYIRQSSLCCKIWHKSNNMGNFSKSMKLGNKKLYQLVVHPAFFKKPFSQIKRFFPSFSMLKVFEQRLFLFTSWSELRNERAQEKMGLKISWIAESFLQVDCWWPKTSGYSRMPGKVSKPRRQHLDHFISQQRALKSLCRQVGSQIRTAVMEIEWCTCAFVLLNILSDMSSY